MDLYPFFCLRTARRTRVVLRRVIDVFPLSSVIRKHIEGV